MKKNSLLLLVFICLSYIAAHAQFPNADVLPIKDYCSDEQIIYQVTGLAELSFTSATFGPASAVIISEHKTGDFNGDGAIDVIAVGNGAGLQLYLNDGSNTFTLQPIITGSTNNFAVRVVDWDRDNDDDFVITQGNKVLLFRNDGAANFTEVELYQGSNNLTDIAIADFDLDLDYDFAVRRLGVVSFVENDGMDNMTRRTGIVSGFTGSYNVTNQLHAADLNADGNIDLIAASSPSGTPKIFINNGNYSFVASVAIPDDPSQSRIIRTGDMDGDGNLDIVVGLIKSIWVLYQDNAGNFTRNIVFDQYGTLGDMEVGDVDGDGFIDIAATGANSDNLDIFYNDGNVGSFTLRSSGFNAPVFNRIAIANYDTDNDLDFICFATNKTAFWTEHSPAIFNNTVSFGYEINGVSNSVGGLPVNGAGTAAFTGSDLPGTSAFTLKTITSGGIDANKNIVRNYQVKDAGVDIAVGYQGQVYANPERSTTSIANGRAYETIPADQTATRTFTLTNSGTSTMMISNIDYAITLGSFQNVFTVVPPSNLFIPAGSSADFDVIFDPNGTVSNWRAEVTVESDDCDDSEYVFLISAGSSQPLPISLINFSTQFIDNQTVVKWETASEIGTSDFQIEWSTNGNDWQNIGQVTAKNRAAHYEFTHAKPARGTNYYRLKMLDDDGSFNYSPIRQIQFLEANQTVGLFYPNPFSQEIQIIIPTSFSTKAPSTLRVYNSKGQLVKSTTLTGDQSVSLTALASGLYYVQLTQNGLQYGERILKY